MKTEMAKLGGLMILLLSGAGALAQDRVESVEDPDKMNRYFLENIMQQNSQSQDVRDNIGDRVDQAVQEKADRQNPDNRPDKPHIGERRDQDQITDQARDRLDYIHDGPNDTVNDLPHGDGGGDSPPHD